MQSPDPLYLFVYGTLLVSADHEMGRMLHASAERIGQGWMRARLYMIDDPEEPGNRYPGAVPSGHDEDRVYGDLYRLDDAQSLLDRFDIYEACDPSRPEPHEFQRRTVFVTLDDGTTVKSLSYMYAWDTSRAQLLPDGRFDQIMRDTR